MSESLKARSPVDEDTGWKYFIGWGGQKRYLCPQEGCAFDTHSPPLMQTHINDHGAGENQMYNSKLFDGDGKPLGKVYVPK